MIWGKVQTPCLLKSAKYSAKSCNLMSVNCCPKVWMFYSRTMIKNINRFHEQCGGLSKCKVRAIIKTIIGY